MKLNTLLLSLLCTMSLPLTALADIYVYQDEQGVTHYTNIKPSPHYKIKKTLREYNGSIKAKQPQSKNKYPGKPTAQVQQIISEAATALNVDQALVNAIIHAESAYYIHAISPKGASGLMQLMPATAKRYGVRDIFSPEQNIWGGVRYMRDLLVMFEDDVSLALAAYNAGENAVIRHGGIPPYRETENYVKKVIKLRERYLSG